MEAVTLKRKKTTISKGKIKKTIKNVICRPDSLQWPAATDEETLEIETVLAKYSVKVPPFKKLPWKELKLIPKNERPKPPPTKKVNGLIFGMSECQTLLQNKKCEAILIEATVNPQAILEPIMTECLTSNIPALCLRGLKDTCAVNFGIPTSCLGIQSSLKDLLILVQKISKLKENNELCNSKDNTIIKKEEDELTETDMNKQEVIFEESAPSFSYLYRTNRKMRVFVPNNTVDKLESREFDGQQFIKFSDNDDKRNKTNSREKYMKMLLKRISNNPNRLKEKNVQEN